MSVNIGQMGPESSQEVANLLKVVVAPLPYYSKAAIDSEIGKYDADSLVKLTQDDPNSVIVAHVSNHPIGFCISNLNDGLIWLAWIGVHPQYRNHGIAGLLFEELDRTAVVRQSHKIWADCRTDNEVMKTLFPKMGYTRICTVTNHWYKHDYFLWEKVITQ